MSDELTEDELAEMERRANEVVETYQGVGGYDEGVWQIECNRYNLASDIPKLIAEVRRLREILTGESPAKAIQGLHRANLIREARASCSLDGETQSEGDSYVLISEDRLKRYESELASLREKVRRLEGAEAENASLD
jgi:hypothetical protein